MQTLEATRTILLGSTAGHNSGGQSCGTFGELRLSQRRTICSSPPRLRLLLHIPIFHLATSVAVVTRSLTQTLYTYTDLARSGNLEPSWPQAQRLLVCGQLLILCQDRGEVQRSESVDLWVKLLDLLDKHKEELPICGDMCNGFRKAIEVFGTFDRWRSQLSKLRNPRSCGRTLAKGRR